MNNEINTNNIYKYDDNYLFIKCNKCMIKINKLNKESIIPLIIPFDASTITNKKLYLYNYHIYKNELDEENKQYNINKCFYENNNLIINKASNKSLKF